MEVVSDIYALDMVGWRAVMLCRPSAVTLMSTDGRLSGIAWGDIAPVTDEEYVAARDQILLKDAWNDMRSERLRLLVDSDWTQMPDSPLTDSQKVAWSDYRQALRDLPANTVDPENPVWPQPPTG